jgi:hypothetical protein
MSDSKGAVEQSPAGAEQLSCSEEAQAALWRFRGMVSLLDEETRLELPRSVARLVLEYDLGYWYVSLCRSPFPIERAGFGLGLKGSSSRACSVSSAEVSSSLGEQQ